MVTSPAVLETVSSDAIVDLTNSMINFQQPNANGPIIFSPVIQQTIGDVTANGASGGNSETGDHDFVKRLMREARLSQNREREQYKARIESEEALRINEKSKFDKEKNNIIIKYESVLKTQQDTIDHLRTILSAQISHTD